MTARPLTAEQAAVVERREGPMLVTAAAGSGKTSVLVERFVRGVLQDGVAPGSLLAITFTDKAAGELRGRVRARFVALGERRAAQDAEGAWISTIHGFCARVLRAHAVRAGLDPAFTVLDEATARELRQRACDRALAGFLGADPQPRPAALDLVAAYRPDRLLTAVLDVHDALRSAGREPRLPARSPTAYPAAERAALAEACPPALRELAAAGGGPTVERARGRIEDCAALLDALAGHELPAQLDAFAFKAGRTGALQGPAVAAYLEAREALAEACTTWAATRATALIGELLERYAAAYAEAKRERAALDYDDLEILTRDLFAAAPDVAAGYAERFARVMVDELQDTNRLQFELLGYLDRGNLFGVGDDLQSIYGFRHADVGAFRERRDVHAARDTLRSLTQNFRSRPEIVEPVNRILAAEHTPLVAAREPAGEPRVELLLCDTRAAWPDDDPLPAVQPWRRAEARAIAARIRALVDGGSQRAADVAVLLRSLGDLATYERALEDAGLATLASGGRGFWARQQVQDLCAYLAALANPRDEAALLGVLASPLGAAASPDALALLSIASRSPRRTLWDVLREDDVEAWGAALDAPERARLAAFAAHLVAERARAPRLGLDTLLERAIERSGYDEHVLALPGGVRRLANVTKLVRLAAEFEAQHGRDVRALVDRALGELEAAAREPDAPVELAGSDAVRLMTIHAAKGLEFPVVVVADLARAVPASTPDLLVEGDRLGLRLQPMHGSSTPALDHAALAEERLEREAQEERRIFHVAATRAQERLILAGGIDPERWPDAAKRSCPPAGWIAERLSPSIPVRAAAGEEAFTVDGVIVSVLRPEPAARLFDPDSAAGAVAAAPHRAGVRGEGSGGPPARPAEGRETRPAPGRSPRRHRDVAPGPAPAPVGHLSYSMLSAYGRCGYRFYLERVLDLPPQDPPPGTAEVAEGLDPLDRGSLVHELLEHADLAREAPGAEAVRARAALAGLRLTDEEAGDVAGLVAAALASDLLARVRVASRVHREQGFALALGADQRSAPLLNGVVDVLAWEPDGAALVVDYKTDRLRGAEPEVLTEQGYGIQRRIYGLAALRAGAQRCEVAHLYLERPDRPAVVSYDAGDAGALEAEVSARAAGLLAGTFEVAAEPHRELCVTCPGRGGLCSWPQEASLRALPGQAARR